MNDLTLFQFENAPIRTVLDDDGNPLFVGKDICDVLGYTNHNNAMTDHCRGVAKTRPLQTAGGKQNFRVLDEYDVLRLILRSHLPTAQRFERWVMEEVLPTIRRTGSYAMQQALPAPAPAPIPLHLSIPDIQVAEFLNSMSTMLALTPNKKQAVFSSYLNLFDATRGILLPDLAPKKTTPAEATPHATATVLLAERGITVSTVQFNHQATVLGLLEPKQSAHSVGSKNGKPLPYHHVTVKGLAFGVNHPMSRDATRPVWYRETFSEMLELLRESEARAA